MFNLVLPSTFKKIEKQSADDAAKAPAAAAAAEGNGNRKKRKENNSKPVPNPWQDKDFIPKDGESWKDTFSQQLPKDRPAWDDKIKMCARWHIKGDCYENCSRAASHVSKDKIPAEKKANFLTFMKACREAAKKGN